MSQKFVKFHAENMKVKSVTFVPTHWYKISDDEDYRPCAYEYDGHEIKIKITSEMRITIAKQAQENYEEDFDDRNMVSFRIEYEAQINSNMEGCYLSSYEHYGEIKEIVATQFESHYAREAFPCIDEPAAKAEFRLTLLTPDIAAGDVVLANMPLAFKDQNRYAFEVTPRMSTYLLAWVIGPLQSVSTINKNGVRVSSYCALNQPLESLLFANHTAVRALEYYDEKFGINYPLSKLDQVALPDFEAGAMENWGLVTYRESMMLADKNATVDTKKSVVVTVTHELSHQWFGNLVTMEWWDDLWLNESFASVMEYYAADAIYPELHVWEDFFTGDCLVALRRDCLPGVQAIKQEVAAPSEIATLFDSAIVYAKGARLILMLIRLMGETAFYRGINAYFERYKYGNTVGDNLWLSLQPFAEFDIKEFMDAWISQPGYPALQYSSNPYNHWPEQRLLIDGSTDDSQWPLPEVKDDMSGHYVIDLGDKEFQDKLAKFSDLSREQKLRLLIDRMLLAKSGLVPSADLLELIRKFASETSGAIWEIVASIIGDLKIFFAPESAEFQDFQKFLRQTLEKEFSAIDFSQNLDPNTLRRRDILLSIAYYAEDESVLKKLVALYHENLATLDSELRPRILSAKLYFDESAVFDRYLAEYQKTHDPELKSDLLFALGTCARSEKHLQQLLALLDQPKIVRPQDHIFLYVYLLRNYRSRQSTLLWLTAHWQDIIKLTGDKSTEDYPRYAANVIRTESEAKIFHDFFAPKQDEPILHRVLEVATHEITARLALIREQGPAVSEKVSQLLRSE